MKAAEAIPALAETQELPDDEKPPLPEAVRRYLAGESVQVIAKERGISRRAVYSWMLGGLGDEHYRELVTQALVGRIADADEKMEGAKTTLAYSKAREMQRFTRMDLERRRPEIYGARPLEVGIIVPVDAALVGKASELLRLMAARVVEGEVVGKEEDESAAR